MALRPETPFKKFHGKTTIYSLPYATEDDLAQTTFRPSAGEDERFSKTLEAQLQGAIRAHARSTPSSYVVFDPTSLVAMTVAGAGLTVQASGTEAFTQETYARQRLKPSGWSGLDSISTNYLWVAPVEEDTSTGRYRSTLEKGDMDFRSTLTADPPADGACLIATWQSGVGFNLNPTGKAYSENVKAHREKSTDPHGTTLTQGHVEVTNLRVINFDIEGAATFEGPETHTPTSTPTFQDTADLDTGRFDAPVQSSAPFNLDSGVPIDGRDPSADFPQLLDGSTIDATKHRHRAVVPAVGALNIPATFPGGWAANKATVAGDVPAWGDYPPVNYANYFSFGNSTLLWPVAQVYSPTLKYDGDSDEGVDNLDLAQSGVFTEGMITDLTGLSLPALGMRTDIPASIELSARVFLPARFKTLKSIDFWHRHANPSNTTTAFRDAKVTIKIVDSWDDTYTLAALEMSQPWTHKTIALTPNTDGYYSPKTFVNFMISGEWPTSQESGINHFFSDIRLTYDTADPAVEGDPGLETPTFSPSTVEFHDPISVTISCATSGTTIHYTTDGTEPTESSPTYSTPLTVSSTTMIRARAFKPGYPGSERVVKRYTYYDWVEEVVSQTKYKTVTSSGTVTVPGAFRIKLFFQWVSIYAGYPVTEDDVLTSNAGDTWLGNVYTYYDVWSNEKSGSSIQLDYTHDVGDMSIKITKVAYMGPKSGAITFSPWF